MHVTKHFGSRMNQRGIRKRLINLTLELGELDGDRIILSRSAIDAELAELQRRMRDLTEARKKGGVVVISEDDALITTYRGVGTGRKRSAPLVLRAPTVPPTSPVPPVTLEPCEAAPAGLRLRLVHPSEEVRGLAA